MKIEDIVKIVNRIMTPWKRRILLTIGRGILLAAKDDKDIQLIQGSFLQDEVKDDVESMAHFGFSSRPPKNSDVIAVSVGANREHLVIIASESREFRHKQLDEGDSVFYNKAGKRSQRRF